MFAKRIADNAGSDKDSVPLAGKRNTIRIVSVGVAISGLVAGTVNHVLRKHTRVEFSFKKTNWNIMCNMILQCVCEREIGGEA